MSDDSEKVVFKGTQRIWVPRLVRLTKAPHPAVNDGEPTPLFVDPRYIYSIERSFVRWKDENDEKQPAIECTTVVCANTYCYVLESPERVAELIDQANERPRRE